MEKHNLMLKALRKPIFWIIIITLDIITFVYDKFFLQQMLIYSPLPS